MAKAHSLPSIDIDGSVRDLSHLESFPWTYYFPSTDGRPETSFDVRIIFSDHCYTKGHTDLTHVNEAHIVSEGMGPSGKTEFRVFNESRYQDSISLPNAIKNIQKKLCSFGLNDNFFTITTGNGTRRYIFFTVKKYSNGQIVLKVESAHDRQGQINISKADFFTILKDASEGKTARPRNTRPEGPKKKATKKQLQKKQDRQKKRAANKNKV